MNAVIQCNPSGFYPIGQAAQILGIDRKTLRRHTEQGFIKCHYKRENGRRVYDGREIIRYHQATM